MGETSTSDFSSMYFLNLSSDYWTKGVFLFVSSCPADPTVKLRGNGKETFNYFAFNMFEFTRGSNQIHLHCEMQLCVKNTNMCEPVQLTLNYNFN